MPNKGNQTKNRLLGQSHGAASNRLRKMLLWQLVVETGKDVCFRCGAAIDSIDDLSIEHKEPWQGADDPRAAFFDLENIAFSHLSCNCGTACRDKTHCLQGHSFSDAYIRPDGSRVCRTCRKIADQKRRMCPDRAVRKRKYNRDYMRRRREQHNSPLRNGSAGGC